MIIEPNRAGRGRGSLGRRAGWRAGAEWRAREGRSALAGWGARGGRCAGAGGWARAGRVGLLCGLAAGLLAPAARAARMHTVDAHYFHRNWRHGDGLPGNSVYAIAQSADRYLWVGTENGLVRFDGRRFVSYGGGRQGALRGRLIAALLAGGDGTLWIGTEHGLFAMRGGDAGPGGAPREVLAAVAVSVLAEDLRGDLWIGTRDGLLRRGGAGEVRDAGLRGTRVTALLPGEAGELWIGTEASGAWRLRNGRLVAVDLGAAGGQATVTGLVQDKDGAIWVFTRDAAHRLAAGRTASADLAPALAARGVVAAAADAGGLWLGTRDRGPLHVAGGRTWLAGPEHPLANASISQVFLADDHTAWFGTVGEGLHQLGERAAATYNRRRGLSSDSATAVWVERDGSVWGGTQGGLDHLQLDRDGTLAVQGELRGTAVLSVLRDSGGTLWAGTSRGLTRRAGSRWETLPHWGGEATRAVGVLHEDERGNLWVGTAGGLGVVSAVSAPGAGGSGGGSGGAGGTRRVVALPRLAGREITGLAEADDGALWIGTRGAGLLRWSEGRLTTLLSAFEVPAVAGLRRGSAHDMWVGTAGNGLLHHRAGQWFRIDESRGLGDGTVRQVIEDRRGDVWICSPAGISRLARSAIAEVEAGRAGSLLPFDYGPEDGIADGGCQGGSQPAAVRGADGEIWFATSRGLVEVRPETLASPLPGRGPRLDGVAVDGRELAIEDLSPLRMAGGVGRLDLRFSFPAFVAQRRTALRYRLAGLDRAWTVADDEGSVHYTNLPPARYRFEVALRDDRGGWGQPVRLAEIELSPLVYQRWSFRAAVALVLAGAVAALLRWRMRRLERRADLLEKQVQARTEELREANAQLAQLVVADPLTGLANRRRLEEALEAEMRRCARSRREVSLVMIDVDHFKAFNDRMGHLGGDECLRRVAAALGGAVLRAPDLVARYGGEEFAVLLPETTGQEALHVAERLRKLIHDLAIPHPGSTTAERVTVSLGVAASVPAAGSERDVHALIEEADEALYRAKSQGRNRVQVSQRVAGELPAWERGLLAWAGSGR